MIAYEAPARPEACKGWYRPAHLAALAVQAENSTVYIGH
jgi:hypothetical protein